MGWLYGLSSDKEDLEVQSLCYLMHVARGNSRVALVACGNSGPVGIAFWRSHGLSLVWFLKKAQVGVMIPATSDSPGAPTIDLVVPCRFAIMKIYAYRKTDIIRCLAWPPFHLLG